MGLLDFAESGDALLFCLISQLYEHTSLIMSTNLKLSEWVQVFGDTEMTIALLGRLINAAKWKLFNAD